ncbi:MAG: hypothetical protein ACOCP8_04090 [archaeon]
MENYYELYWGTHHTEMIYYKIEANESIVKRIIKETKKLIGTEGY